MLGRVREQLHELGRHGRRVLPGLELESLGLWGSSTDQVVGREAHRVRGGVASALGRTPPRLTWFESLTAQLCMWPRTHSPYCTAKLAGRALESARLRLRTT